MSQPYKGGCQPLPLSQTVSNGAVPAACPAARPSAPQSSLCLLITDAAIASSEPLLTPPATACAFRCPGAQGRCWAGDTGPKGHRLDPTVQSGAGGPPGMVWWSSAAPQCPQGQLCLKQPGSLAWRSKIPNSSSAGATEDKERADAGCGKIPAFGGWEGHPTTWSASHG